MEIMDLHYFRAQVNNLLSNCNIRRPGTNAIAIGDNSIVSNCDLNNINIETEDNLGFTTTGDLRSLRVCGDNCMISNCNLPNLLLIDSGTSNSVVKNSRVQSTIDDNGTDSLIQSVIGNQVIYTGLPTSNPNESGQLWNDGGIPKISSG